MTFTVISNIVDCVFVSQHEAQAPDAALVAAIGQLPYDDGDDDATEPFSALVTIAEGVQPPKLIPVAGAVGCWSWQDAPARCSSIVVLTDSTHRS